MTRPDVRPTKHRRLALPAVAAATTAALLLTTRPPGPTEDGQVRDAAAGSSDVTGASEPVRGSPDGGGEITSTSTSVPSVAVTHDVAAGEYLTLHLGPGHTSVAVESLSGHPELHLKVIGPSEAEMVNLAAGEQGSAGFSSVGGSHQAIVRGEGRYRVRLRTTPIDEPFETLIAGEATTNHTVTAPADGEIRLAAVGGTVQATVSQTDQDWSASVEMSGPLGIEVPTAGEFRVEVSGSDVGYRIDGVVVAVPDDRSEDDPPTRSGAASTDAGPPPGRRPLGPVPYSRDSAVNLPIPADARAHPNSETWLARMNDSSDKGRLTSDVTQNSYTVYYVDRTTPRRSVKVNGSFSRYVGYESDPDGARVSYGWAPTVTDVPVPTGVASGGGGDGQLLLIDTDTGEEWGFWQWDRDGDGNPNPEAGYVYDYVSGNGRTHQGGRGAGLAKLFGLVTAASANADSIDHAIAVAFPGDTLSDHEFVYPATKSDGEGGNGNLPEGARLQLDTGLTDADFDRMGLTDEGRTIARAMQRYGLIVVDRSGRNKVFMESSLTGDWAHDDKTLEYLLDPLVNDGGDVDWNRHFHVIDFDHWTGGQLGIQPDD